MGPDVLLLDEPMGALDALTRATLQDEIERIFRHERKTVLLVTNSVDEALRLADRVTVLRPGPGATIGPSFDVRLARPRDRAALNHDLEFKKLRNEVTGTLLQLAPRGAGALALPHPAPHLRPRDLRRRAGGSFA
jgi:nitrate/nitrite transport system ATP-binding protein